LRVFAPSPTKILRNEVFHAKLEGGLGIRPLWDMNEALKARWLWSLWRPVKEEDAFVEKGD